MEVVEFLWKYGAWTLFIVVCVWAFWKGGPTERAMATLTVVTWGISMFIKAVEPRPGPLVIALEAVTLVLTAWLAIHSRRVWVFFAAASTLCSVAILVVAHWLQLGRYGLVTALGIFGTYGPLIALAFGVWEYQRIKKKAALKNAASE